MDDLVAAAAADGAADHNICYHLTAAAGAALPFDNLPPPLAHGAGRLHAAGLRAAAATGRAGVNHIHHHAALCPQHCLSKVKLQHCYDVCWKLLAAAALAAAGPRASAVAGMLVPSPLLLV